MTKCCTKNLIVTTQLAEQMKQSVALDATIRKALEGIGYGT